MIQRTADGKLRQRQDDPALRVPPNMGLAVKGEAWKMTTVRDVFEGIDCVRSPWRLENTPWGFRKGCQGLSTLAKGVEEPRALAKGWVRSP
jgi:hypothetical protein